MRYKKAEQGPVATIILIIVFVIIYFLWLGQFNNDIIGQSVANAGITGVEAFGLLNFNLWVYVFLVIGTIAFLTLGLGGKS